MSFLSLGLSPSLLQALEHSGYSTATPIQHRAIPAVLRRRDVLGIARTGSGKTAAFVLPLLQLLEVDQLQNPPAQYREPRILVLVPTRELADQVQQVFQEFLSAIDCGPRRLHCLAVFGGVAINPQMQALGNTDILIATPGRLLELIDKNAVKLSAIATLVLDEADKMLNLGFKQEVDRILALLPPSRQNLLFSATLSEDLTSIQKGLLTNPVVIKIAAVDDTIDRINQFGYFVSEARKGPLLRYLIKHENLRQVLVFASSTRRVDNVVEKLCKNKIDAAAIHGKKSQQARRSSLQRFKSGELRVLVTTDLLGRGIDIEYLPCVINYELPRSPKDYIHRIGRTGRADSPGDAIALVTPDEEHHFRVIQKKMGKRIPMDPSDAIDLQGF